MVTPGHSTNVLIQNGLNIANQLIATFPANVVLSGVSLCGAYEPEPGRIIHNDSDKLLVGAFKHPDLGASILEVFISLYQGSGKVTTEYDDDVDRSRWRKLLYNAVYNPISALTNLDTSRLRASSVVSVDSAHSLIHGLIRPAMKEIQATALATSGVILEDAVIDKVMDADPVDGFIMPSMQQDTHKGCLIECGSILGEALRAGEAAGVPMPIIRTLYCLCAALQFRAKEALGLVNIESALEAYKSELEKGENAGAS